MISQVRVRFAPSPTGLLHIGNARTALYNYLFAKHHQGSLILRIEDTDLERSSDAFMEQIMEDLKWLGLTWQEGPDAGGSEGPYRQSLRSALYHEYADQLSRAGKIYKCFCTEERLENLRKEQLSKGKMPRYDGKCRSLTPEETAQMKSSGIRPVLRFHVEGAPILFDDLIHGKMQFDCLGIGDFIIVRSDGMAAYNFACVVDDHLMKITHVIRGEDHLSNTPRQVLLCRALSWEPPVFAHHPLILGPDHSPLSKRHGATAVSQYREEGFLPEALQNYLILMGWTSPSGKEIFSLETMAGEFSIQDISKSAPIYNRKKLEWLNTHYLREKTEEQAAEALLPFFRKAGLKTDSIDRTWLNQISGILKENLITLSQVGDYLGIFFDEKFSLDEEAKTILLDPKNRETLQSIIKAVKEQPESESDKPAPLLDQLVKHTGKKGKELYAPLRAAVTGKIKGPELAKTLPLLRKEIILKRLQMALEFS